MLVRTKLCECWGNVGPLMATSSQRCGNITSPLWGLALRKCSGNVVWMWPHHSPVLGTDVERTIRQFCVNAVAALLSNIGDWCWDNIQATLYTNAGPQYCTNIVAQYCTWSSQVHNDSFIKIWILDTFSISASISTVEHSELYYLPQRLSSWVDDVFSKHFPSESTQLCLNTSFLPEAHFCTGFECKFLIFKNH